MNQQPALTHAAIKLLDTYIDKSGLTGFHDYRPKTVNKLKNILKSCRKVIYVSPILDVVIASDGSLEIGDPRKSTMQLPMLNKLLWEKGKEKAESLSRYMHMLPCDSPEHEKIKTQLKQWFETDRYKSSTDPMGVLLGACTIEFDMNPQTVLDFFESSGMIIEKNREVKYNLPSERIIALLTTKSVEYEIYCESFLQEATVQSQKTFITHLAQVNSQSGDDLTKKMELYSEDQFAQKYPKYDKPYTTILSTPAPTYDDDYHYGIYREPIESQEKLPVDIPKDKPYDDNQSLPLNLTAEITKSLLLLCNNRDDNPSTVQALKDFLQPACKILYLVSPVLILPSLQLNKPIPSDYGYRILIGTNAEKTTCTFNDPSQLVTLLRFKKKSKPDAPPQTPQERYREQLLARMGRSTEQEAAVVTPETKQEKLKNFHAEVIRRADNMAKHSNAVLLYGNDEAQKRCRERFSCWFQEKKKAEIESCHGLSRADFTTSLFDLSCDAGEVSVELLLQMLTDCRYLTVDGDKIKYNSNFAAMRSLEDKMKQLALDFERKCEPHCAGIKDVPMDEAEAGGLKRPAPRRRFGGRFIPKKTKTSDVV